MINSGSNSVLINGKGAGRVGDSVSCGGSVAQGSPDVFIGG
ncbi:PAAR domain-containing protein [Acidaminococcus massiliensis]|nr:MAG TPA: Baseplate wedge protein [Caudoviricetes sp.]